MTEVRPTDAISSHFELTEDASAEESLDERELASVIFTSARKLVRVSVVKTECSLLILSGAQVGPTSWSSNRDKLHAVNVTAHSLEASAASPGARLLDRNRMYAACSDVDHPCVHMARFW